MTGGPRFDWSINLGHILMIVSLLGAAAVGWNSIQVRLSQVEERTADYSTIRDMARDNAATLRALSAIAEQNAGTNRMLLTALAEVREDLSAIRATLAKE